MFTHASAVESVLAVIALAIFALLLRLVGLAWQDIENVNLARRDHLSDLLSPRAVARTARQSFRRQMSNLAMSFVFVALTVWALEVPPPPPIQTLWEQITFGKCILFLGLLIIGDKALAERRARGDILEAIVEDNHDRRGSDQ